MLNKIKPTQDEPVFFSCEDVSTENKQAEIIDQSNPQKPIENSNNTKDTNYSRC